MSAVLTSYQMAKLTKTFAKLDTDNSGAIDVKELKRGLIGACFVKLSNYGPICPFSGCVGEAGLYNTDSGIRSC